MPHVDRVTLVVPTCDGEELFPHFAASLERSLDILPAIRVLRHRNPALCGQAAGRYDAMLRDYARRQARCSIEEVSGQFNYSSMLNSAMDTLAGDGEFVCLANDDIVFATPRWLDRMVEVLDRDPDCAIAGCRLLYPRNGSTAIEELVADPVANFGTVQHAGVAIVQGKGSTHIYKHRPHDHADVLYDRDVDAVTFALVVIRSELLKTVRFDPRLDCDFNDIDFCLEAREQGFGIRYVASSVHYHLETVTRRKYGLFAKPENKAYFMGKWQARISQAPTLEAFTRMEPYHE